MLGRMAMHSGRRLTTTMAVLRGTSHLIVSWRQREID